MKEFVEFKTSDGRTTAIRPNQIEKIVERLDGGGKAVLVFLNREPDLPLDETVSEVAAKLNGDFYEEEPANPDVQNVDNEELCDCATALLAIHEFSGEILGIE